MIAETETSSTSVPVTRAVVQVPIRIPAAGWGLADIITFSGLSDPKEHLAIRFRATATEGASADDPPLVRVHSECLTGDVFGSGRCDCGPQLEESVLRLAERGGILLYLRQEGRGIGLYNKLDAYRLQDRGLDTFAANRKLDFEDDPRSYEVAVQMLHALGIDAVCLMTNNPQKVAQLSAGGVRVAEVIPTGVYLTEANAKYLKAKSEIAGHALTIVEEEL